jgi:hypothetical protein
MSLGAGQSGNEHATRTASERAASTQNIGVADCSFALQRWVQAETMQAIEFSSLPGDTTKSDEVDGRCRPERLHHRIACADRSTDGYDECSHEIPARHRQRT